MGSEISKYLFSNSERILKIILRQANFQSNKNLDIDEFVIKDNYCNILL